jgi:transposase
MTHDYKRHGTTDLFAALNVATGEVLTDCHQGHTALDVLRFFKQIDKNVNRRLEIHVVLDNLSAHKAPEIATWLAHPRRKRWHLPFTPTSSSWLNLVERWFKELTDKRLRRGAFTSVPALTEAIATWIAGWNADPKPFVWHKTGRRNHREGPTRASSSAPDEITDGALAPSRDAWGPWLSPQGLVRRTGLSRRSICVRVTGAPRRVDFIVLSRPGS